MKKINLFISSKKKSWRIKKKVEPIIHAYGYQFSMVYSPDACINMVIGGDGTFLAAVQESSFSPLPFLGINTGHLGFFQTIDEDSLEYFLKRFFQEDYYIDSLRLLQADILTSSWNYRKYAVNEFYLTCTDFKVLQTNVMIDGVPLINQAADGIMVATPQGSTAHNLSAGGSILYQTLDGFHMKAISPIRSKSYDSLPSSLVIPSSSILKLSIHQKDQDRILLLVDGLKEKFYGVKEVHITNSNHYVQRIVFDKNWYWLNLKDKFL